MKIFQKKKLNYSNKNLHDTITTVEQSIPPSTITWQDKTLSNAKENVPITGMPHRGKNIPLLVLHRQPIKSDLRMASSIKELKWKLQFLINRNEILCWMHLCILFSNIVRNYNSCSNSNTL